MRNLLVAFLLLFSAIPTVAQHTYYVSKSAGADTNTSTQAQSKSTPWQHLKGMASCSSNCSSYNPVAGDQFILMGCDVWVPADFPVNWDWSGTSGSQIYVGVDQTWFNATNCPSTWNRPVFDGQNTFTGDFLTVSPNNNVSWVTFDWIEMKRHSGCEQVDTFNPTANVTWSNFYIHAWNASPDPDNPIVRAESATTFITGIVDGSDSTPTHSVTCRGFFPTPPNVLNSVVHDLPNGILGHVGGGSGVQVVTWAGNSVYNINTSSSGSHCNAFETVGGGTYYIYNNAIHDMFCPGGSTAFLGNSGETDYFFNNIVYNLGTTTGNTAQTPQVGPISGGSMNYWNDTIVKTADSQSCIFNAGQGAVNADVHVRNVHCIQASAGGSVSDFTDTSFSLQQSVAQASSNTATHFDQYTATETIPYSPLASTNSTVGAATNLTSNCSGPLVPLCHDAVFYVQTTINGVVQTAAIRTSNSRPSSGAWDIGAYQFSINTLAPPTNLHVTPLVKP